MSDREYKYPLVCVYQYVAGREGNERDYDVYCYREELVDLIKEKHGEDIEGIRIMKNGPGDRVVFEITVAPGKAIRGLDDLFYGFLALKDAERELARAEALVKRIKARS